MKNILPNSIINSIIAIAVFISLFLAVEVASLVKGYKFIGSDSAPQTTIAFSGTGEISAAPDIALINLTERDEAKTVKQAQDIVTGKVSKVLSFLKGSGIEDKDIKTDNYSSYPKYDYKYTSDVVCGSLTCPPRPTTQIISGYEVSQAIAVTVRNIDATNLVVEGLGKIGITEMSGPNFAIDKEDVLKVEARRKAIDDAKAKAEVLAKDLGVQLVRIINFSESGNYSIYDYKSGAMALSAGIAPAAAPQLPTGENKITSNVTITYEIR